MSSYLADLLFTEIVLCECAIYLLETRNLAPKRELTELRGRIRYYHMNELFSRVGEEKWKKVPYRQIIRSVYDRITIPHGIPPQYFFNDWIFVESQQFLV